MPKVSLKLSHQSEPTALDCKLDGSQFAITLGETNYEGQLTLTGPGEGWLVYDGRTLPFYMTRKQETVALWLKGKTYHFDLMSAASQRGAAGGSAAFSDGEIKAPMPGTVLKVLVQAGQAVEANQPLLIMESMKMEMTLSAPQAATVESAHCAEGQLVEMATVLITLNLKTD